MTPDIKIQALGKVLKTPEKIDEFLNTPITITAKLDGLKVSAIKHEGKWVLAHKNRLLYKTELDFVSDKHMKNSMSEGQFKFVHLHFEKVKDSLPNGTILFIEFAAKKSTLSSNYSKLGLILLSSARGVLDTKAAQKGVFKLKKMTALSNKQAQKLGKAVKLKWSKPLFEGTLMTDKSKYIDITGKTGDDAFNTLVGQIRSLDSEFGGPEEGAVIEYNGTLYKIQQEYQTDPEARKEIKLKNQGSPEDEKAYWEVIHSTSKKLADQVLVLEDSVLENALKVLSTKLVEISKHFDALGINLIQVKRTKETAIDDIQNTTRRYITKKLKGNNGSVVIGKFRVFTTAHLALIKKALNESDDVYVVLVTGKDTKATRDLRFNMLKAANGKLRKRFTIIEHTSGNINSIVKKIGLNVNNVYVGSDRTDSYKGFNVVVTDRPAGEVSATKVIDTLIATGELTDVPLTTLTFKSELKAAYIEETIAYEQVQEQEYEQLTKEQKLQLLNQL